jgi:hypothetical protein
MIRCDEDGGKWTQSCIATIDNLQPSHLFKPRWKIPDLIQLLNMPPSEISKTETGIPKPDSPQATALLHRVPWKLPIAVSAEGIYIDLQDGRRIIDAVGGAAVSCIGSGHPAVKQALIDQIDKMSCNARLTSAILPTLRLLQTFTVCNSRMGPLRSLDSLLWTRATAHLPCAEFCLEVGLPSILRSLLDALPGTEAVEAVLKLAVQVSELRSHLVLPLTLGLVLV